MKTKILKSATNLIRKTTPNYSDEKLEVIEYGLEAIYMLITKMVIITGISVVLGIFKEYIIVLLIFNSVRFTGFGLHAKNSNLCLYGSALVFLLVPYVCSVVVLNSYIKLILGCFCTVMFLLYAPSDTQKRPIVNPKRRMFYKTTTCFIAIILTILSLKVAENFLSNAFLFGMLIEVFMIHPLVYKLFKMPYNNYKKMNILAQEGENYV